MIQTTQMIPDGDGAVPVTCEAGGTFYPTQARETLVAAKREKPLCGVETKKELEERLRRQFHAHFKMDVQDKVYANNEALLEAYREDVGVIRMACDEVRDSLRLLYRLDTQFESQSSDAEWNVATDDEAMRDAHYSTWSKGLDQTIAVGDYGLSTRLTDLLVEEGPQALERRREECLNDFIHQICKLLDQMVDQQQVGVLVFGQDRDCTFHFFRDALIEFESDRQTVRHFTKRRAVHEGFRHRLVEVAGVQADVINHRSTVRRTRQDVYLREVEVATFGRSRMPIPPTINEFLYSLPDWLRNSIRIVEGDRYEQQFYDYEIGNTSAI